MIKLNFILINLFIINIYCKHSDSTTIKTNQSLITCSNVPSQKNSCDLLYQFSKILENNSAPSSSFSEEFKDNSIKENIRIIFPKSSLRKNLSSLNKNIKKKNLEKDSIYSDSYYEIETIKGYFSLMNNKIKNIEKISSEKVIYYKITFFSSEIIFCNKKSLDLRINTYINNRLKNEMNQNHSKIKTIFN